MLDADDTPGQAPLLRRFLGLFPKKSLHTPLHKPPLSRGRGPSAPFPMYSPPVFCLTSTEILNVLYSPGPACVAEVREGRGVTAQRLSWAAEGVGRRRPIGGVLQVVSGLVPWQPPHSQPSTAFRFLCNSWSPPLPLLAFSGIFFQTSSLQHSVFSQSRNSLPQFLHGFEMQVPGWAISVGVDFLQAWKGFLLQGHHPWRHLPTCPGALWAHHPCLHGGYLDRCECVCTHACMHMWKWH